MNRSVGWVMMLLVIALVTSCWGQAKQPPKVKTGSSAAESVKQVASDLKEARNLLKNVADKPTRERLELLLSRSELRLVELQQDIVELVGTRTSTALSDATFAELLKQLKKESFDNGKLSFVESFGGERVFTSEQVRQMLSTFAFDNDRAKAALVLHAQVIDPENFFTALEAFTFDSNRKQVRDKLKAKR